ncbi:SoxY-related AACIE arm protein [Bradyrhizobium sp. LHD-71]|uniref:SoxY-related AACIE arm protein n=1 Tax=Bradyrhizobium sp. LHD-71 TaxID=3072141 RepID=UPI00280D1B5E|nr:SoxY-related AACIE arm protein [Bradyrhizobium sp. LHD-71]MDQ8728722.1 SoxY-related AACIE arm protein [Bradyrhizobium sp. LHD-71]
MSGFDLSFLSRRRALIAGAGALSTLIVRPARATTETMQAAIHAFSHGAPIRQGRLKLDIPPLVENGNSVPLVITVDSPMTEKDFVKAVAVFNERNPQPNIATFHLGPRSGRAFISTRIRLGDSQTIMAIAQLSDGTLWSGSAELIVTLPACVEN